MSQLKITSYDGKIFNLNVTQFRSTMSAQINSVQLSARMDHFPIRCGQPDINFSVQFPSLDEKNKFESWVRNHQLTAGTANNSEAKLFWAERNIINWSGYVTTYRVANQRFNYAPSVTFGVSLVDSLMSTKTTLMSLGADVSAILGVQIPAYTGSPDTILITPTAPLTSANVVNPQDGPSNSGGLSTPPMPVQVTGGSTGK